MAVVISAFHDKSHYEPDSPGPSIDDGSKDTGKAEDKEPTAATPELASREPASPEPASHADSASSVDHVYEKTEEPTLTRRQKLKRHCGRFWLWYLIGSIILLAILLPIIFKVIFPAIVQAIVNQQSLPVNGGAFLVQSPTELMVSLDTSLNTPLGASLDPLTLFLYNQDTPTFSPFLNVTLPSEYVKGYTEISVTNETVTVTNETELITWFGSVFDEPNTPLSIRGDTTVHIGALNSNAHIDKTVGVSSLNKLSGFGIKTLDLSPAIDANGHNINGTANLPNWGVMTIGLGNLSLNVLSGDLRIGLINMYNVVLPPGNNSVFFDGTLYLDTIISELGYILTTQAEALSQGNVELNATGNSTMVHGQHVNFVEAVLNNRQVTSSIPVLTLFGDVLTGLLGSGDNSIFDVLVDVLGNTTLLEQAMSHWGSSSGSKARNQKRGNSVGVMTALTLFKLGMKW